MNIPGNDFKDLDNFSLTLSIPWNIQKEMGNQLWYLNKINTISDELKKKSTSEFPYYRSSWFLKIWTSSNSCSISKYFLQIFIKRKRKTLRMKQTKILAERSIPTRIPEFCRSTSNQGPEDLVHGSVYRKHWNTQRTWGLLNALQYQEVEK